MLKPTLNETKTALSMCLTQKTVMQNLLLQVKLIPFRSVSYCFGFNNAIIQNKDYLFQDSKISGDISSNFFYRDF